MTQNIFALRLLALRQKMREKKIDAYLIPTSDPHLSEYIPDYFQARSYISGFDGSAGLLIVTLKKATLWTDSRYFEQAHLQLKGSGIVLMKIMGRGTPFFDWLKKEINGAIGFDGTLFSLATFRQMQKIFGSKNMKSHLDLIAPLWNDRPPLPTFPLFEHKKRFVSLSRRQKLNALKKAIEKEGANSHLIISLDEIAWLLNLRGSDIAFNPVFMAYLWVGDKTILFIDLKKVPLFIQKALKEDQVTLLPYENVLSFLKGLPQKTRLLVDENRFTASLFESLPKKITLIERLNPTVLLKSRKSAKELQCVRDAMVEDGIALCEFYAHFENSVLESELTVAEKLQKERQKRKGYISLSFDTIAGFKENGALPHYRATEKSFSLIKGQGLLLIDSGAQYEGGTTDITRVVPIGKPTRAQQKDYTTVLKGLIALSTQSFPDNTKAPMIDAIARSALWQEGLNYGHGTGHGVGYFLNVHEGPQNISYQGQASEHSLLKEGMITSIEPGLYRPQKWGIRLENLVAVVFDQKTEFGNFLKFETLTLCPFERDCIDRSQLSPKEIQWINHYHKTVLEKLLPSLSPKAQKWLKKKTKRL